MPNEAANEEQVFLVDLLKAIYQNQEVYPILQHNLSKLNDNLALRLRKWISDRFAKEPANAINIARGIFKLSKIIHSFEQGNLTSNLQIAIAGYETVLQVYTREAFPKESNIVQQALVTAYQQQQHTLSKTLNELQQHSVQTQTQIKTVTEQLQQELKQRQIHLDEFINIANILPKIEPFNTAIFYDIENLTMGKNHPNLNFSLKNIQTDIEKVCLVNKIAIQCAYADWSDSRLRPLKNEIQELGIEPVQIFDYGHKRNAADIQLAIDVMELAESRPMLQTFAIVSGDGAFAALAKKLHEYGKNVIGCAYETQANRIFKSVCDRFLPIPAPQSQTEDIKVTEIINDSPPNDDILVTTKKVLQKLKQNIEQTHQLKQGGIDISQIHKFLRSNIPEFDKKREKYGKKLTSFLKKVIQETDIYLSIENNKLIWREITTSANGSSNKSLKILTNSSNSVKEMAVTAKL